CDFLNGSNGESEFEGTSDKLSQSDPQKLRGKKRRDSSRSAVPKHSIDKERTSNIIRRGNFLIGWWVFSSTTVEFGQRPPWPEPRSCPSPRRGSLHDASRLKHWPNGVGDKGV